jgi:hypothetical protein
MILGLMTDMFDIETKLGEMHGRPPESLQERACQAIVFQSVKTGECVRDRAMDPLHLASLGGSRQARLLLVYPMGFYCHLCVMWASGGKHMA